ncbi:hypothetical protein [Alienimonas sp. DA493]|uniref:hypothetical protein n=1 Tax=Alienimonas sp. DA493 TaxID=3373605 RepID=UPI003753F41C
MFRLVTPLTTLAAVLAHAVLGCCLHHAHADGAPCGAEPAADHVHVGHAHGCGSHGPADDGQGDHGHDEGHRHDGGCNESECIWLTAPFVAPPALAAAGFSTILESLRTDVGAPGFRSAPGGTSGVSLRGGPGDRLRTRVFLL